MKDEFCIIFYHFGNAKSKKCCIYQKKVVTLRAISIIIGYWIMEKGKEKLNKQQS